MLRIAMIQMNPIVGDLQGNLRRIARWFAEGRKAKADVVAFPELALTGYPPEDLLLKPRFLEDVQRAMDELAHQCRGLAAVIGYVSQGERRSEPGVGRPTIVPAGRQAIYNAAAFIAGQKVVTTYGKRYLPNYGVFDESRYFHPGRRVSVLAVGEATLGVNICEDIWVPEGPTRLQALAGAEVIININASPFHVGKGRIREQMLATRARDNGVIVSYTNMVGGQDELVFDGNSLLVDHQGEVIARGKAFEEDMLVADLDVAAVARARVAQRGRRWREGGGATGVERVVVAGQKRLRRHPKAVPVLAAPLSPMEEVYQALVLGVRDYARKNGFKRAVIGLSGGIDSALTAVIAVDALGAKNVLGVFMPSPYTSPESGEDVAELVQRLRIEHRTISITSTFRSYLRALRPSLQGEAVDSTEENIQARIRGNLLMALSNKFGYLVLTTGNKSELSVGYATLYGDMAGGFAVIKDVPKTMVYELARHRNDLDGAAPIPKRIFDRAPTAELRPNQKDEDSLPPYPILDPILKAYVEEDRAPEDIVAMGFARPVVDRVIAMVDRSEYKRRQAPIGIKITHRAFGKDRRMPITNGYRRP
ncbi:MAG: NAD+ synthase [Nitrospirae bacterium]|nr:NAD+ synthase [Nitrospirota bacterium]